MEFKDRVKQLRTQKSLTQPKFAERINKTINIVRYWESGAGKPNGDALIELSHFFNCSVDYLLGLTDIKQIVQRHKDAM